ncbi:hypothetical protein V2J09_008462 [Rumex salicifolius]
MARIALGSVAGCGQVDALKATLAEFISMLMFVFAGQGSAVAFNKVTNDGSTTPEGLVAAAMAHAFSIIAAVSVGANISGSHVNQVVTLGALIGGHITLARTILYWIAQCLGSVVACLILKFATSDMVSITLLYTFINTYH